MRQLGTQRLHTPRLILRPFALEDAAPMFRNWAGDPEVTLYLSWETHPDEAATRQILALWAERYVESGFYNWAIEKDGEPIGSISCVECNEAHARAEIGYCLSRKHWGQGLMTEALTHVMAFLFEDVGVHRIYLRHDAQNIGSGRVMEKSGLRYEATMRAHHCRKDGTWGDMRFFGLLRDEWLARRGAEAEEEGFVPMEDHHLPAMARLYADVFNAAPWNDHWSVQTAFDRLLQMMRCDGFGGMVCLREGRILALALGNMEPYQDAPHFHLKEFCVDRRLWGQGIGTALFKALCARLKAKGVGMLWLFTGRDEAAGFYEKMGLRDLPGMIMMGKKL